MKNQIEYLFHTLFVIYIQFVEKLPTIAFFKIK